MPPTTLHPQYIVDAANQKHSVILPLAEFEALMEDLEDLAAVAERREEPAISHDQLLAELKKTARSYRRKTARPLRRVLGRRQAVTDWRGRAANALRAGIQNHLNANDLARWSSGAQTHLTET